MAEQATATALLARADEAHARGPIARLAPLICESSSVGSRRDPRPERLVKARRCAGLGVEETAAALRLSKRTVSKP